MILALFLACGGAPEAPPENTGPIVLGVQDIATVSRGPISAGPRVAGTLEAADRAVLRAEAAGSVEKVAVEIGDRVKKGDLLVRIEGSAARGSLTSARSGVTSAEQDLANAGREVERARRLVDVGALASRDAELAQSAYISAQARLDDARSRRATSAEQVGGTTVRSPMDGIVSERAVSQGDVVAPGAPLITVLEPSSLRLQGAVPAEAVGLLRVGSAVQFEVQGHPDRTYAGVVERIAPAVDTTTRQIPVLISIPNAGGELMSGLFAEGRIATELREGLVVPSDALLGTGEATTVRRVRGGSVEEVKVRVGLRDDAAEKVELTEGVEPGDVVLVGPARDVSPGTAVQVPG